MAGTAFDAYAKYARQTTAPQTWGFQAGQMGAGYIPIATKPGPDPGPGPGPGPGPDPGPDPGPGPGPGPGPAYTPAMSDYGYSVNINVPDFNWQPTEDMLAQYLQSGGNRANTVIDPQVQAVLQALSRFKTEAQNTQNEINPRYTDMSLALANIIKNQVYQPGVNQLIRRGAADSGALQQLGESAGRYETEQRGAVERERNQILNALANQVMGKEQETSDAQTALEKLRGQYTDVYAGEEEQKAYGRDFSAKESKFNADLSVGQLQNAVAAAIAQQQYQNAVLAAQQQQTSFENSQSEKEFALQQALANYQMRPKSAAAPTVDNTVKTYYIPGIGEVPLSVAIQLGYFKPGPYAETDDGW